MAKLSTLSDDFEDGSLNTTLWNDNQGTITESGGFASVPPSASYNFLGSSTSRDFTNDQIVWEWTFSAAPAAGAEQFLEIRNLADATDTVNVGRFGTNLGFIIETNGVMGASDFITWDSAAHRFIRVTTDATTIHFEASSDGQTWNDVFGANSPVALPTWPIDNIGIQFLNGFFSGSGAGNLELQAFNAFGTNFTETFTDSATFADTLVTQTTYKRALTDSVTAADTLFVENGKRTVTDTAAFADTLATQTTYKRALTDSVTATDAADPVLLFLEGRRAMSAVAWLHHPGPTSQTTLGILNGHEPDGTSTLSLYAVKGAGVNETPDELHASVHVAPNTTVSASAAGNFGQTIISHEVHMVAMTWVTGRGIRLYTDGQPLELGSGVNAGTFGELSSNQKGLWLGVGPNSYAEKWSGLIDDVTLFGRALSDAEVLRLYQTGLQTGPYGTANYAEWPQGVFLLSTPTRGADPADVVTREVEGYDQLQVYADDLIVNRTTIASGAVYTDEVSTLLGSVEKIIEPSDATLPVAKEWEPGTSKLAIINELLGAINYESLSFDEHGRAIVKRFVPPADRAVEFTYQPGPGSVIIPEVTQELDLFSVANRWVLVVSDPDRPALVAVVQNNDPASLTSTVRRGRVITDFRTEQDAADQATLDAKALRLANEASQVVEGIEFETGIMPFHSGNDAYRIIYPPLVINAGYTEHKWSMDLRHDSTMSHRARRVVDFAEEVP